jgi:hypothetical protein
MGGVFNTINGHLYHYAGNNPIKLVDPDGRIALNVITAGFGAVAGAAYGAYKSYNETGEINWGEVGKDALIGGTAGFLLGAGVSLLATGGVTAAATTSEVIAGLGEIGAATSTGLRIAKGVDITLKTGEYGQVLIQDGKVVAFSKKAISHIDLALKSGLDPKAVVGATVSKATGIPKIVPSASVKGASEEILNALAKLLE